MNPYRVSLTFALAVLLGTSPAAAQIDVAKSVLTERNDNARRGAYLSETMLTPSSVNSSSFGHRYSLPVKGPVVAQPLFAKGVNIGGKNRDVLYVVTRMNFVHAFDVGRDVPDNANRQLWELEVPVVPTAPVNQPVTAVFRDSDHLDLFIAASDGRVFSNFWERDHGWWHEWFPIRPDTAIAAAGVPQQVTAVWGDPNNPQHLNLFMVDKDGAVKSIFCTIQAGRPCWQREAWFAIGPARLATPGQPVTAVWRDSSFTHLDLFVAGQDGKVLSNFWDRDSGWHEWFPIRPDTAIAAAGLPQQVTAVWGDPNNPQHLNLFMVDKDGAVKSIFCTLQPDRLCWQREAWFAIGPARLATPGQPVTAVWRDSSFTHLDLFIVGQDGRVLSNFWDRDSGWHEWFPIRPDTAIAAAGLPQQVTAVWGDPNNPQHLNLFMVDKDGAVKSIYCTLQARRPCWQQESWFSISPFSAHLSPGQSISAVWRDSAHSHLDLFASGAQISGLVVDPPTQKVIPIPGEDVVSRSGTVVSNFWENAGGWGTWFPVPLRAEALPGMDDGNDPICRQTHGHVGIVSTPVIDPRASTMYVVYRTGMPLDLELAHHRSDGANYRFDSRHWIAAIDLRTGRLRQAPVEIVAEKFDPTMQLNRPALLLQNGTVIVAFGSAVCDAGGNPYRKGRPHGWVFAYRMTDLSRLAVFTTASTESRSDAVADDNVLAGIWQSGTGLSSDSKGNIYAFTGNNMDTQPRTPNFSESILKLRLDHAGFSVDHYRVPEADNLDALGNDGDLGAGAPVLPFDNLLIGGGKQGVLYQIQNPAGRWPPQSVPSFQAFFNTRPSGAAIPFPRFPRCDPTIRPGYAPQTAGPNLHGSPVIWQPANKDFALAYGMPEKDYVRAFKVVKNSLRVESCPLRTTENVADGKIRSPDGMPGGFLSISASGGRNGILWASVPVETGDATITSGDVKGRLIAMNALTLEKLWEDTDESTIPLVAFAKFVPPTIAQGQVFRAAYKNAVHVYGLKSPLVNRRPAPPRAKKKPRTRAYG